MAAIDTVRAAVEAAVAEIDQQLAQVIPKHEGARDYALLDIAEGTRREIVDAVGDLDRRVTLLNVAKAAYLGGLAAMTEADQALVTDGAPILPVRQISAAAVVDLDEQLGTLTAARGMFVEQASTLGLVAGEARPKPPVVGG